MLDDSSARIRLLIAPAGYGKTTLAREWLGEPERSDVWYRGGPASADVAALAAGISEAAGSIIPDAGKRMRERVRATGHPEEDVDILAELFAEDVQSWPAEAWLAIDDYQFAMESVASERFVDLLTQSTPIQMLITSRRRPSWATARRILYGEIQEIDRRALAMEDAEACSVLGRDDAGARALIARAQGWPAVLGIASGATATSVPAQLPAALYDYFAEELYQGLSDVLKDDLARLAVLSGVTTHLVRLVLGARADEVLEVASAVGAIAPLSPEVDLHPLLQDFLLAKLEGTAGRAHLDFAEQAVTTLAEHRKWDEAFNVVARGHAPHLIPLLLAAALNELLQEGRAQTVSLWAEFGASNHVRSPVLDLSEAEIAFRQGQHALAERLALQASNELTDPELRARALIRAGQSAMLDSRDEQALISFREARRTASGSAQHEALVGECLATLELGLADQAPEPLHELQARAPASVEHTVRQTMVRLVQAVKLGGIDNATRLAAEVNPLVAEVRDPLIQTAYLNTQVHLLVLGSRYAEAAALAKAELAIADHYRLKFVRPHALLVGAIAHVGLREFTAAKRRIDEAEAQAASDVHITMYAAACRARIAISRGSFHAALNHVSQTPTRVASEAMRAEQHAYRALAAALLDEHEGAAQAADQVRRLRGATVEALILVAGAEAICSLAQESEENDNSHVRQLVRMVNETGVFDSLVTVVRGSPAVLRLIADDETTAPWLSELLIRSNDFKLAEATGIATREARAEGQVFLTPREHEVARLLMRGYRNRQIADALFISEATAKVHVRHIREKVGGSSRTELAARLGDIID